MSSEYKSQRMTQLLFVKHTGEDSLNKVTPVQNSAKTIPVMIEKLHNSLKERKGEGERERIYTRHPVDVTDNCNFLLLRTRQWC